MRSKVSSDMILVSGLEEVLVRTCLVDCLALKAYYCVGQRRMMCKVWKD